MSNFKIQTDFPLPQAQASQVGQRKYPFNDLPIGGMFFIPDRDKNTMSNYASSAGRDLGRKFTTRLIWAKLGPDGRWQPAKEGEAGAVQGIGVWRLADPEPKKPAAPTAPEGEGEAAPTAGTNPGLDPEDDGYTG